MLRLIPSQQNFQDLLGGIGRGGQTVSSPDNKSGFGVLALDDMMPDLLEFPLLCGLWYRKRLGRDQRQPTPPRVSVEL
jgi:hypothetical protein